MQTFNQTHASLMALWKKFILLLLQFIVMVAILDSLLTQFYNPETLQSVPGCSKITISLVNISLKFQILNISNMPIFFVEKMGEVQKPLSFFKQKIFNVFGYKVVKHLTS